MQQACSHLRKICRYVGKLPDKLFRPVLAAMFSRVEKPLLSGLCGIWLAMYEPVSFLNKFSEPSGEIGKLNLILIGRWHFFDGICELSGNVPSGKRRGFAQEARLNCLC